MVGEALSKTVMVSVLMELRFLWGKKKQVIHIHKKKQMQSSKQHRQNKAPLECMLKEGLAIKVTAMLTWTDNEPSY